MAFTTTTGAGGTSLIGTSGVDTLSSTGNSFPLYIGAQESNDIINFSGTVSGLTGELGKGADTANFTSLQSSDVVGGDGNDSITLTGALTNASVKGGNADDTITLAALTGGFVNGNSGNDIVVSNGAFTSGAKLLGGQGNDEIFLNAGASIASGVVVNGNEGNDDIILTNGVSVAAGATVFGGKGNDVISQNAGGNAAVIFSGDDGNDELIGGGAADTLYGGSGNDTINGGSIATAAVDSLIGGDGSDTFTSVGTSVANTGDIISDFAVASDKVDVSTTVVFGGASSVDTGLTQGVTYAISGTYSSTGVFTAAAVSAGGFDTLIAVGAAGGGISADQTQAILKGVLNSSITSSNLV